MRKIDGYLPTSEVAFIDEIFKANSAILNALLTLLNERLFDNGNQRLRVPLLCLVSTCIMNRSCMLKQLSPQGYRIDMRSIPCCTPRKDSGLLGL